MKTVFFGYSTMGYRTLEYLLQQKEDIIGVFTHRDKPGENIYFPSVSKLAEEWNVPVYFGEDHDKESLTQTVQSLLPECIFSAYYKNLIPAEILKIPTRGAYNVHGSLLPKFRGRCPANWQILMGETRSGVTIHVMEPRADTGAIVGQKMVPVDHRETAASLNEKHVSAAVMLLREVFPNVKEGSLSFLLQSHHLASKFGGRKPEDGLLDWTKGAVEIDRLVRAVTHPFPGAFSHWEGKKFFVWKAYPLEGEGALPGQIVGRTRHGFSIATGAGLLEVLQAQLGEEEEMPAHKFWERYHLGPGIFLKNS